jgi:hypothetical protein
MNGFSLISGDKDELMWMLHNPEIEEHHNRRPLVRRACGHLEPIATAPVPGGEHAPGMIEQLSGGTYILVDQKSKLGTRMQIPFVPPTGEVVPHCALNARKVNNTQECLRLTTENCEGSEGKYGEGVAG